MLIDATHPEETRVVVTRGNRVEEFDYESASRKQLRGNIYLAKVARIEPSLQAAFVNYGGNRHGFLAFAEIHPDYYQIPVAVREALMKEEAADRQGRFHDNHDNGSREPEPKELEKEDATDPHGSEAAPIVDVASPNSSEAGEKQLPIEEQPLRSTRIAKPLLLKPRSPRQPWNRQSLMRRHRQSLSSSPRKMIRSLPAGARRWRWTLCFLQRFMRNSPPQ